MDGTIIFCTSIAYILKTIHIQYRQKYRVFEKHNGKARIWQFDLLDMSWLGNHKDVL